MSVLINHVRKVSRRNVITTAVSDDTYKRLLARCAQLNVPRAIVVKDFIEFCLDIIEGGELVDQIKTAMAKGKVKA
jgi:hypothetical protein